MGEISVFEMAVENFDIAVEYLGIASDLVKKLRSPERCLIVSIPVRMDGGEIEVFEGYRILPFYSSKARRSFHLKTNP